MAAVAALSYRVRSPEDLDKAVAFYRELGCRVERRADGFATGVGDSVRVQDPLGFPYEFFHDVQHVERLAWRYDLHPPGALVRLDHFNQVTPDVPRAVRYLEDLGFRVTEDIQDDAGTTYAAWMRRKPTVHDTAMTGGNGPRLHHVAFATHEKHNILAICDKLGALRLSDRIERGPGRHGVSNAFYLYLRDPDGHRIEIYTQDYYTGDPDNPVVTWDVHDNQRRDWWGNPVVPSWYTEASLVLDLDGVPQPRRRPHGHQRDGGHHRRRRVLLHPQGRRRPTSSRAGSRASTSWGTSCDDSSGGPVLPAETITAIADELAVAERDRTTVPLLTARHPGMTVEDAYAVQGEWRRRATVRRSPTRRPQDRPDVEGHAGRDRHRRAGLRRDLRRHGLRERRR